MAAPVLVIDFGSQVTQLIARRVREAGVYCEIVPFDKAEAALSSPPPRAIILSGGPASLTEQHTPKGAALLSNFVTGVAAIEPDWNMRAFHTDTIRRIRHQVGNGRVICGLSGGVDSSVAAVLIHEAIGEQLTCIFVDTGLMRTGEAEEVVRLFSGHFNIPLLYAHSAGPVLA